MKSVSRIALGVALVLGGASLVAVAPAGAQQQAQAQKSYKFSKEERAALAPLQTAVAAKDWAAAQAALPAAQAAATGADARYVVARFLLEVGLGLQNEQMQAQAIDALIASGGVPAADLPMLYRNQGALASKAGDKAKAEAAFARYAELSPNDPEALINLARIKNDARKPQEAVQLLDRAIALRKAAGQTADQSWYRFALKLAYEGKLTPQALKVSRELVQAYPTKENWRDALLIYRDLATLDKNAQLDLLRLGRATQSLAGERDWFELAETLDNAGLPAEAKAVLEEGASLRMVDLNKPVFRDLMRAVTGRLAGESRSALGAEETKALAAAEGNLALRVADAYMGYRDYAKAASLYRAAATKAGVDANLANTRLGMALALAGNRAEAEAAFKAVTGARADIAAYWLTWLAQRG